MDQELRGLFKGYRRDLMQGQTDHFEIVCEKDTLTSILSRIAYQYGIPLTTGRGYCSLPPRAKMVQRFKNSGKNRLVLLMASNHDPDGEEIAHSFARSLRDDFGVAAIRPVKVALTQEQVQRFGLVPRMTAKETSAHHDKFVDRFGHDVFELDALSPERLTDEFTRVIDSVIDIDAFNRELDIQKDDATYLAGIRKVAHEAITDAADLLEDDDTDE